MPFVRTAMLRSSLAGSSVIFVLSLALVGCSDGGSEAGSPSNPSTPGGGTHDHCFFDGTLSGGVSGTIAVNGCATSTGAQFSVAQAEITKGTSLGVRVELNTALKGGETGRLDVKKFVVFQQLAKGQPHLNWESTTCEIELTKSEASPTQVFENRFILTGKGSCPSPLEPASGNTQPAVTVTGFNFGAFIDP